MMLADHACEIVPDQHDMLPTSALQLRANPRPCGQARRQKQAQGTRFGSWSRRTRGKGSYFRVQLLPGKGFPGVNGLDAGQTGRPKRSRGGIVGAIQPRQFRLDGTGHRLAQHAAEIERPESVWHRFG